MLAPQQPTLLGAGMLDGGIDPKHARKSKRPPEKRQQDSKGRNQPQRHGHQPSNGKNTANPYGSPGSYRSGVPAMTQHPLLFALFKVTQEAGHDKDSTPDQAQNTQNTQQKNHTHQRQQISRDRKQTQEH